MTHADAILKPGACWEAGEFTRSATGSTPDDIYWNSVALECGHSISWCSQVAGSVPERVRCIQCAKEWINANSEENGK
jgi:hypothetical protein